MNMYAALLEAVPAGIPNVQLVFDPSPLAFIGLVALAVAVGSALGVALRREQAENRKALPAALARPVTC